MAIALDSARNAYITGGAGSAFNPVPIISQNSTFTGLGDAYIAKISSGGSTLVYLEYIGGRVIETGYGIDVDNQGNAYITGETFSWSGFPIVNPYQPVFGGYSDAFVTKVGRYGSPLLYSTYLGGSDLDSARAIDVDSDGYAHITGLTWSLNLGGGVTAPERKVGEPVIEVLFIERGDIRAATLVLGMAGAALLFLEAAVVALLLDRIPGDVLVTVQAQAALGTLAEAHVALLAVAFEVGVTLDYLAGHERGLNRFGGRRQRETAKPRDQDERQAWMG